MGSGIAACALAVPSLTVELTGSLSVLLLSNRYQSHQWLLTIKCTIHFCALQFHAFKAHTWCVLDLIYTGGLTLTWSITADCGSHWILAILCYIVYPSITDYCWVVTIKWAFANRCIISCLYLVLQFLRMCHNSYPNALLNNEESHHCACWLLSFFFLIRHDSVLQYVSP